jgi:hypothetical protein
MQWRTLVITKTGMKAVKLAVERGWLLAESDQGVCLTAEGWAEMTKRLS